MTLGTPSAANSRLVVPPAHSAALSGGARDIAARAAAAIRLPVGEQSVEPARRQETRRAAADEDRVNAPPPNLRQHAFQITAQGVQVSLFRDRREAAGMLVRVEIAIRTLLHAPGEMHVERQRRQCTQLEGFAWRRCIRLYARGLASCWKNRNHATGSMIRAMMVTWRTIRARELR